MRVPGGTPLSHGARAQQRSIVGKDPDDSCLQKKFDSISSMPTLLYDISTLTLYPPYQQGLLLGLAFISITMQSSLLIKAVYWCHKRRQTSPAGDPRPQCPQCRPAQHWPVTLPRFALLSSPDFAFVFPAADVLAAETDSPLVRMGRS